MFLWSELSFAAGAGDTRACYKKLQGYFQDHFYLVTESHPVSTGVPGISRSPQDPEVQVQAGVLQQAV